MRLKDSRLSVRASDRSNRQSRLRWDQLRSAAVDNAVQPLEKRLMFSSIGSLETTYGQSSHSGVTVGDTSAGDPALQIVAIIGQPGTITTATPSGGTAYTKTFTAGTYTFLVSDGTGAAEVYKDTIAGYVPTIGDTIKITANWSPFSQLPEFASVTAISKTGSAAVPAPVTTSILTLNPSGTTATYSTSPTEPYSVEGYPLLLQNVTVSGVSASFSNNSQNTVITDSGGNQMVMYTSVASATSSIAFSDVAGAPVPSGPVNILGYVEVFRSGTSPNYVYQPEFYPNTLGAPVVAGLSVSAGPTTGTNTISIQGYGFSSATGVSFGGTPATSFTVSNTNTDQVITAVVPAHGVGTVDVTVTGPTGTSVTSSADQYAYTLAPAVLGISPTGGPTAGGTVVTISGSNFAAGDTVSFGSIAGTNVAYNATNGTITATSPAGTGTVDVTVSTPSHVSSAISSADQFTYANAPTVTGLYNYSGGVVAGNNENSGIDSGGDRVVIAGTNLGANDTVSFGTVAATNVTYNAANGTLTAVSPAGTAGTTVDVTVTNPTATSATSSADQFTYTLTNIAGTESPNLAPNFAFTIDSNPTITQILEIAGATVSDAGGSTQTYNYTSFYIQDSTGSEDVFGARDSSGAASLPGGYIPVTGNTIKITAQESPYQGTPELGSVTAISTTGTSTSYAPVAPVVTTIPAVNTSSPLPVAYDGYIVTIKGVYISGLLNGAAPLTTFGLNESSIGGVITDTNGNTMSLFYSTTYNQAAVSSPGDPAFTGSIVGNLDGASVPTSNLVDVTGWVDINNSGITELNLISITNPSTVAPVIQTLTASQGPLGGTNTVTITGEGLTGSTAVSFGGTPGTNVSVVNDRTLTVTAPAHALGTVNVTVTNENGASNALPYVYTTAPVVSGVTPGGASTSGGVPVVITGTGFTGATAVSFGTTTITSGFVVNSDTQITVNAPAHAAGQVDVTVTGTVPSSTNASDKFIYDVIPTVSISPSSGADSGGTKVIITGTSLLGTTAVNFGTVPATSFSYNAANGTITAIAPAQALGTVADVTVTNYAGTSAIVATDKFTYVATTVAVAQAASNGVFVTIDSNPVITAILSEPGTVNGETYPYYAFLINDGTGSEDVFYNPSKQSAAVAAFVPVVGNTITVTGDISDFRQIDEIGGTGNNGITAIANTGTAAVPAPIPETVSAVNISTLPQGTGFGSHLITLSNVTVTGQSGNVSPTSTSNGTLTVTDSTGHMTLFVYTTSYSTTNEQFAGAPFPAGPETLTGFVYVFTSGSTNTAEFVPVLNNSTIPAWLSPSSQAIWNPNILTNGQKTLYVNGASTIISNPGSDNPFILAPYTVNNASSVTVAVPTTGHVVQIGGLGLTAGASLQLAPSAIGTPTILVDAGSGGIGIDSTSHVDITNNFLDVKGSTFTTVSTLVGTGNILSSSNALGYLGALGVIQNQNSAGGALYATIGGISAASSDVLLRYTYYGDTNLDGVVNSADYVNIDNGFLTSATGWGNGDLNGDGVVNGSDYTLIDNAFNTQGNSLGIPTAQIATPALSSSNFAPSIQSADTFFSDKKVKTSLISSLEELITAE